MSFQRADCPGDSRKTDRVPLSSKSGRTSLLPRFLSTTFLCLALSACEPSTITVTVAVEGSGTGTLDLEFTRDTPESWSCTIELGVARPECARTLAVEEGAVRLTAAPYSGTVVTAWGADCAGQDPSGRCELAEVSGLNIDYRVHASLGFPWSGVDIELTPSDATITELGAAGAVQFTAEALYRGFLIVRPVEYDWYVHHDDIAAVTASSPSSIATVTGLRAGETRVAARAVEGSAEGSAPITVISVAGNAPVVTITSPDDSDEFSVYDRVAFRAHADDAEDGFGCCTSTFAWTDVLAGQPFGTETVFGHDSLTVGEHVIQLTVQDLDGNQGTGSVDFNVRLGGLVVFQSPSDQVITTDGLDQTYVIDGERPDLSPDGSRIVFTVDAGGDDEIWVADADGTNPLQLTDNTVDDDTGIWSPDGSRIVFTHDEDIWVMDSDGSNAAQLTTDPGDDSSPDWRGDVIVFTSDRDGDDEIWSVPVDLSSAPVQLTDNDFVDDWRPSWTPDGRILFTSERDGNSEIYIMDADGSNPTRLTDDPAEDEHPHMSPDGSKIVFSSERLGGVSNLFVMRADGSGVVFVRFVGGRYPRWKQ